MIEMEDNNDKSYEQKIIDYMFNNTFNYFNGLIQQYNIDMNRKVDVITGHIGDLLVELEATTKKNKLATKRLCKILKELK